MTRFDLSSDLLNYIVTKGYQPGDKLPTIGQLASDDHLGISVSKVREQLEVARALGLVEVRSKTGTRLKDYTFTPAVRLSLFYALAGQSANFESFSQLRIHVETSFWHEACALLTEDDKSLMRQCITQARDKLSSHPIHIPNDEHRTFHLTVFKQLDNPFVLGLLEAYWDTYEAVEINRYAHLDYFQSMWDYHEQILDFVCEGDYEKARQAFIEHTHLLRYPTSENNAFMKGDGRP